MVSDPPRSPGRTGAQGLAGGEQVEPQIASAHFGATLLEDSQWFVILVCLIFIAVLHRRLQTARSNEASDDRRWAYWQAAAWQEHDAHRRTFAGQLQTEQTRQERDATDSEDHERSPKQVQWRLARGGRSNMATSEVPYHILPKHRDGLGRGDHASGGSSHSSSGVA